MSIRSLFNIILKILGILFIQDILAITPQLLSMILYFEKGYGISEPVWTFIFTILILLMYGVVSYYLIFKSDVIIDKLRLDKGFDQETIQINVHRSTILSISTIVIGGIMVVDEIPNFCRQLFAYSQQKRMTYGQTSPTLSYTVLAGTKVLVVSL